MVADFLAGELEIGRGGPGDYEKLARFHYVAGRPGTWAGVWVARYKSCQLPVVSCERPDGAIGSSVFTRNSQLVTRNSSRIVAIAVLSWSPLGCTARESVLHLKRFAMAERARWINKNLRTISRVVVHPQFRGVGLGSELVRRILQECPTRYVETIAAMGKVHPFFEKAGMRRVEHEGEKAYFIFDSKDQK